MFCSSRCCTCSRRREPAPTKLTADTRAPRSSMPLHSVWKCACRLCVRGLAFGVIQRVRNLCPQSRSLCPSPACPSPSLFLEPFDALRETCCKTFDGHRTWETSAVLASDEALKRLPPTLQGIG